MNRMNYDDAPVTVRDDLVAAHQQVWDRLASAGTWLDGATRLKVAAEARHARNCPLCAERKDALIPNSIKGSHDTLGELSDDRVEMIHRIVSDPGRLTQSWANSILETVPDTEYVEIVSIIAHITAIDTFGHALGLAPRPLPDAKPGTPVQYRPAEARLNDAWLPNIAHDEYGPNEADLFKGRQSNIRRALTLVPDEARSYFELGGAQYLSGQAMQEFVKKLRAITRAQIELVAGRVSAINQCTY